MDVYKYFLSCHDGMHQVLIKGNGYRSQLIVEMDKTDAVHNHKKKCQESQRHLQ